MYQNVILIKLQNSIHEIQVLISKRLQTCGLEQDSDADLQEI